MGKMMKINNCQERVFAATVDELAALVADFDRVWPTEITAAPRQVGRRLYRAGIMVWEEFDRPGATRAFRVVSPEGLQAEHWFNLEHIDEGVRLRHTIAGEAVGEYETVWCEQIEPTHGRVFAALFDRIETALGRSAGTDSSLRPAEARSSLRDAYQRVQCHGNDW